MVVEAVGQAFAEALGQSIGHGIGAAFFLLFSIAISSVMATVLVFLIGLQKRPRTTLLSYGLAALGGLIGDVLNLPVLVLLGFTTGIIVSRYRFDDTAYRFFTSRGYTALLIVVSGGSLLISTALLWQFMAVFGPYLQETLLYGSITLLILALPGMIGATYLFLLYRHHHSQ